MRGPDDPAAFTDSPAAHSNSGASQRFCTHIIDAICLLVSPPHCLLRPPFKPLPPPANLQNCVCIHKFVWTASSSELPIHCPPIHAPRLSKKARLRSASQQPRVGPMSLPSTAIPQEPALFRHRNSATGRYSDAVLPVMIIGFPKDLCRFSTPRLCGATN